MELVDFIGKINIGINFFGIVAGLASIIGFVYSIVTIKDAKKLDYNIKIE